MRLGVREVAHLFDVTERTVYRWVREDALPAHEVEGQSRFHRAEVLEWATARDITPSPEIFDAEATSPETSIAAALRRRACEAGDESSCVELASGLMDGRDVPRDPEAAVALLRGACDRGQASPCAVLGYIYSNGQGVAADPVAGRRYTQMACERGLQAACGAGGR